MSERHAYIRPGISREAFQDVGVRLTMEDPDLSYFLHAHPHDPYGSIECNDRCQVIHSGEVKHVTQTDDANSSTVR